jgi:phosphatidylglycerophosphate synthase
LGEPAPVRIAAGVTGWREVHHGIDPASVPLLPVWLRAMRTAAKPLVRVHVPPIALTGLGVIFAGDAVALTPDEPLAALGCVLASAVCDGLDGAVAVASRGVTRAGAVADAIADRVSDAAFAVVVGRCGAPYRLAATAGGLSLSHELLRVFIPRTRQLITIAERPTRVICTSLALICVAMSPATWPATVCGSVWATLAAVGLGQLVWRPRPTGTRPGRSGRR